VRNVLLVDDEPTALRMIGRLLRQDGHDVVEAGGLGEALEAANSRSFDAAVVDVDLKDGNGMMVVSKLLVPPRSCASLVMSAHPRQQIAPQAVAGGAHELLFKPFGAAELRPKLALTFARTLQLRSWFSDTAQEPAPGPWAAANDARPLGLAGESPFHQSGLVHALALTRARLKGLTKQQTTAYLYLAAGHTYEQTGEAMAIAPRTVEGHADTIRKRLGAATNAELSGQLLRDVDGLLAGRVNGRL